MRNASFVLFGMAVASLLFGILRLAKFGDSGYSFNFAFVYSCLALLYLDRNA